MTPTQIIAEWKNCPNLRQSDIDGFISAEVPIMALAQGHDGRGLCLARDRVVLHPDGRRFEFTRHARGAFQDVSAYVVVALDRRGQALDLVAIRGGAAGFVAPWLGRAGLLGEDNLDRARDVLVVHPSPMAWLRDDRRGVVVVDAVRAALMLRDAGRLEVETYTERQRLLDLMRVRLPDVSVRGNERRAAA